MADQIKILLLIGAFTVALAGCSSGSDEDGMTLSGVAGKGLLAGANVQITSADGEVLATTSTDDLGAFSVDLSEGVTGQVAITVSARNDGSTLMLCDLSYCGPATATAQDTDGDGMIRFGEWQALDAGTVLTTLIELNGQRIESLAVNYGTHMATQCALGGRDFSATLNELTELMSLSVGVEQRQATVLDESVDPLVLSESLMIASLFTHIGGAEGTVQERMAMANGALLSDCDSVINGLSATRISSLALQAVTSTSEAGMLQSAQDRLMEINSNSASEEQEVMFADLPPLPPEF